MITWILAEGGATVLQTALMAAGEAIAVICTAILITASALKRNRSGNVVYVLLHIGAYGWIAGILLFATGVLLHVFG